MANGKVINGEINPVEIQNSIREPLAIKNAMDYDEEVRKGIVEILDQMDSYREIFFIMPEFYIFLNRDKSLVLKILKEELEKRQNIVYVKRVDVDFKGIKGRYQCFKLSPKNPGTSGLEKFFVEFSEYLESNFRKMSVFDSEVKF
jgi:hypothetical protein